jgi:hypothetical protein
MPLNPSSDTIPKGIGFEGVAIADGAILRMPFGIFEGPFALKRKAGGNNLKGFIPPGECAYSR